MDIVREKLRLKHYSYKTEITYINWIKNFILFHNKKHPSKLGKAQIEAFLTHLAVDKKVASSTQNQAFNAILFLYEKVLGISLKDQNISALRAKRKEHVPVVLTKGEVKQIIYYMNGIYKLMLQLLYGCGLRLNELLNLRIKDIDFGFDNVYIFDSKSQKDRVVPLPQRIKDELKIHIKEVRKIHKNDLSKGFGEIHLPQALERKYPNANKEFKWQFLFPMKKTIQRPGNRKNYEIPCFSKHIRKKSQGCS